MKETACLTNIEGDVPEVVQFQEIAMTLIPLLEVVGRRVFEHRQKVLPS